MLRNRIIGFVLAFAIAVTVNIERLSADVIQNASFEMPAVVDSFLVFAPGDAIGNGWILDPLSGSNALLLKSGGLGGPTTNDGGQYLLFGAAPDFGILRQDVILESSTPYRLTFELGDQPGGPSIGAGIKVDMLFNGVSILGGQRSFSVPQGSPFATKELLFNSGAVGSYRLHLTADGNSTSVDAFNLVVVPEPSALTLLSIATIAFSVTVRCRKRERC